MFKIKELTVIRVFALLSLFSAFVLSFLFFADFKQLHRKFTVINEYNKFFTAVEYFKQSYGSYPGDYDNNNKIFLTSGGNMDGKVVWYSKKDNLNEGNYAWQMLDESKLLDSGVLINNSLKKAVPGTNIPGSQFFNKAGWSIIVSRGDQKNALVLGGMDGGSKSVLNDVPVFTIKEAVFFDQKLDDGNLKTGKLVVDKSYKECFSDSQYLKVSNTKVCLIDFMLE